MGRTGPQQRLSVELRIPRDQETDLDQGRWLYPRYGVALDVTDNRTPAVPTRLANNDVPCATAAPYPYLDTSYDATGIKLDAVVSDPDQADSTLTAEIAVWPIDDPGQRTSYPTGYAGNGLHAWRTLPASDFTDGASYGWQVRVSDGTDTSAWSASCYFTVDSTRPSAPPVVTSPDVPPNGSSVGGTPFTFTFSANGVPDVAGYDYRWDPYGSHAVPAECLGGSATVTTSPPLAGPNTLYVDSFDRAHNRSAETRYEVYVADTSPVVSTDGPIPFDQPFTVRFAPGPHVTGVTDYTYAVNGGDPVTVPADPDGTAAVPVTLTLPEDNLVTVHSHSANGWVSPDEEWRPPVDDAPWIDSATYPNGRDGGGVGVAGTFTFSDWVPGAVSYQYSFDSDDEATVTAGADGTASVTWTPTSAGYHSLFVYAVYPDGTTSTFTSYDIEVAASP